MNFHLEVKATRGQISRGEDCWIVYSVENRGDREAPLFHPGTNFDHTPVFYLRREGETGRELRIGGGVRAEVLNVAPGQKIEGAFRLDRQVSLGIGAYELSAVLDPAGLNLTSNPVRLEVRPFDFASWTCVPFGLPEPGGVYFSWIRDGHYWEQAVEEDAAEDQPLFRRQSVIDRGEVGADAVEPCTASGIIDPDDSNPVRWIFWRVGLEIHSGGVATEEEPIHATLPEGAWSLAGTPLMDRQHRADLLYTSASELSIVRFCDPGATPGATTGVLARVPLPAAAGLPASILDPPAQKQDRRHIVFAEPSAGLLAIHYAVLGADGPLTPFRRFEWKIDKELAPVPDSRPAVRVLEDGSVRVRAVAADMTQTRKFYVFDVRLDEPDRPPATSELLFAAGARAARPCLSPPLTAWWLEDGTVVVSSSRGVQVARKDAADSRPELVALTAGAYLVDAGPDGLSLLPL